MYPSEKLREQIYLLVCRETGLKKEEVEKLLERPPENIDADLAFPCFSLAKTLKKPPAAIADGLAAKMKPANLIKSIKPMGPYLNFYADWSKVGGLLLKEILAKKGLFGSQKRKKRKILLEFAHPNTHKAFHIGHVRNITLGESLARILEFAGFRVIKVNYQGDIGPHVAKCLWGLLNLGLKPPKTEKGLWLGEVYSKASKKIREEGLDEEVREVNKRLYAGDSKLKKLWQETRKWSLEYFDKIYRDFNSRFDRLYFESEVEGPAVRLAEKLLEKGTAKLSEEAIVMDLQKYGLGIYVLLTKDKTPLYSIKDFILAELQDREFRPDKIIHIVGTEQILHFRQLFKSLELTNPVIAKKEFHLPYELVNLKSGKMASREGRVITYDSLKKEVFDHAVAVTKKHAPRSKNLESTSQMISMAAIKYDMLKQSPEKVIVFDWEQALSFEGNAAPYLQYTCVRTNSILNKRKQKISLFDAVLLKDPKELSLLKKLLEFPEKVSASARDYRPHYIANYIFELAAKFNEFYEGIPVLQAEGANLINARLALVKAAGITIKNALNLLGIETPERM